MPNRTVETPSPDAALVLRAQQGEVAAFEQLAARHARVVLGLTRQVLKDEHTAEDVAQEVLLLAYRALSQLQEPAKFGGWLYRIALREARRALAAKSAPRPDALHPVTPPDAEEERRALVRAAVNELEEPYRLAVTLRYLEGLNASEIGVRLEVPSSTVRAWLARARPLLQEKLRSFL
jgi:RNA polymerase sigma-70 factor (ECF subfamily)